MCHARAGWFHHFTKAAALGGITPSSPTAWIQTAGNYGAASQAGGWLPMHAGSLPEFAASVRLFAPSMHVDSLLCSIHHPTPPLFATLPPPLLTPTATATTTVVVSLSAAGSIFFVAYDTGTKEQFLVSIARAIRGPHKADAPPAPAPSSNAAADTAAAIFGTLGALGVAAAGEWYMRQLLVRYCCCYVGGVAALVRSFPT